MKLKEKRRKMLERDKMMGLCDKISDRLISVEYNLEELEAAVNKTAL